MCGERLVILLKIAQRGHYTIHLIEFDLLKSTSCVM